MFDALSSVSKWLGGRTGRRSRSFTGLRHSYAFDMDTVVRLTIFVNITRRKVRTRPQVITVHEENVGFRCSITANLPKLRSFFWNQPPHDKNPLHLPENLEPDNV